MLKDVTYKKKFAMLAPWLPRIIQDIKKDLKTHHLKNDWGFLKENFPGKNINKLNADELAIAYGKILEGEKSEELGDFIANRWLLKHSDIYYYFEKKFTEISPDFDELESIDEGKAREILDESIIEYGPVRTYIFSVINSVIFPEKFYKELAEKALTHVEEIGKESEFKKEHQDREALIKQYERELSRQSDKYEKKLLGLQKKYEQDTESLKKQIAALQKKLNG